MGVFSINNEETIFTTGIYIRVSTEEQAREGFSIKAQIEKLKQYAFARSWVIHDFYIDDGISGKNIKDRPNALRLIEDIKDKKIDNVLVYKIDRLTRSTKNLIELIELFSEKDCAFNSLMEAIDTSTATGRMFIKIVGIFAEFERENLAERVSFGYEQKTREGNYTNTHGVYGYDYVTGTGDLVVNIEEAEIVKQIYDLYLQGTSMIKICKILTTRQVPTKRGGNWSQSTIASILTNPLYIGKIRYGVQGKQKAAFTVDSERYEHILNEDIFYRVQDITKRRKQYSQRKYPSENAYFLTFLFCCQCGHRLGSMQHRDTRTKSQNLRVNYMCHNKKIGLCDMCGFSHNKVEQAFSDYINNFDDFVVNERDLTSDKIHTQEEKKNNLIKEMAGAKKRLEELRNLFVQEKLSFEEYREFANTMNTKLKLLENEQQKCKEQETEEISIELIKDIVGNFRDNWVNLNNAEKKEFLTTFVSNITVQNDNGNVAVTDMQFTNSKPKSLTKKL